VSDLKERVIHGTVCRVPEHEAEVLKAEIVARAELAGGVTAPLAMLLHFNTQSPENYRSCDTGAEYAFPEKQPTGEPPFRHDVQVRTDETGFYVKVENRESRYRIVAAN
jgi:hypothetical protein